MKFSHSLQINAVPEWTDKYLAYSNLKKAIYQLEKEQTPDAAVPYSDDAEGEILESAALLREPNQSASNKIFIPLLDRELQRIVAFYTDKERELEADREALLGDIERVEVAEFPYGEGDGEDEEGSDEGSDDEDVDAVPRLRRSSGSRRRPSWRGRRASKADLFSDPTRYNESHPHDTDLREAHYAQPAPDSPESSNLLLPPASDGGSSSHTRFPTDATRRPRTLSNPSNGHNRSPSAPNKRPSTRRLSMSFFGRRRSATAAEIAPGEAGASVWTAESDYAIDQRIMFKRRITDLFVAFSELKQYVELNRTGMKKILKKYDKITDNDLKDTFLEQVVDRAYPFQKGTIERPDESILSLAQAYAKVVTLGDVDLALKQLRSHLREHIVLERNTVWRQMVGQERRAHGISLSQPQLAIAKAGKATGIARYVPSWLSRRLVVSTLAAAVLMAVVDADIYDRPEEQNCLAILIFCTILWSTEAVPLFVTSLMVPFLVVVLRVIRTSDDERAPANDAAKYIFSQMMNPTIFLLLGGFTIAAALSKHGIDRVLAMRVLSLAGTRPSFVLLAHMAVACFASMWISNVAAPVLCFSLIQPILRKLPPKSPYAKSLILGIALAANIGGQASPIASPQNLIALQAMDPPLDWLQWFAIALPVSAISLILIWLLLLLSFGSGRGTVINRIRTSKDSFTPTQWFIAAVTIFTIALWCVEHTIEPVVGDMGVIAIIPIVAFFGTGVLTAHDFNSFLWTIVFLAMGGIALGKAVVSSGLLDSVDQFVNNAVAGMGVWQILAVFSAVALVVSTFISHTIAAVLLVPIAAQVGQGLETPHPRLLIMATALICSAGMGLPVSGFPNISAVSQEDEMGERYLFTGDFLKNGIPASILAAVTVDTVGYLLMRLLGL